MYEGPVFNYVLRIVGDRALAEDLTQEIFLRIYQGLRASRCAAGSRPGSSRSPRTASSTSCARERKPQAIVTLDDLPLEVVDTPPERTEVIDAVWRAVGSSTPT